MKRLPRLIYGLAIVVGLSLTSGCVDPAMVESADYGVEPTATQYELAIRSYMEKSLKDPESARYKFFAPSKGWTRLHGQTFFGWFVTAQVNAKNSFGGYTGAQTYVFFFFNGQFMGEINPTLSGAKLGG